MCINLQRIDTLILKTSNWISLFQNRICFPHYFLFHVPKNLLNCYLYTYFIFQLKYLLLLKIHCYIYITTNKTPDSLSCRPSCPGIMFANSQESKLEVSEPIQWLIWRISLNVSLHRKRYFPWNTDSVLISVHKTSLKYLLILRTLLLLIQWNWIQYHSLVTMFWGKIDFRLFTFSSTYSVHIFFSLTAAILNMGCLPLDLLSFKWKSQFYFIYCCLWDWKSSP